jgi:AhpD family alkylhydroperoxidase
MCMIPHIPETAERCIPTFKKRTYTFSRMMRDVAFAIHNAPYILNSNKTEKIDPRFAEHIMLAVTAVNGCKYCTWVHTEMALKSGCDLNEVKEIMGSNFKKCEEKELIALAFAQHYAQTQAKPTKESIKRLISTYGIDKAKSIIAYISFITIGNLTGNTIDAVDARIKGIKAENSSLWFELLVYIIGFPFHRYMNLKFSKK